MMSEPQVVSDDVDDEQNHEFEGMPARTIGHLLEIASHWSYQIGWRDAQAGRRWRGDLFTDEFDAVRFEEGRCNGRLARANGFLVAWPERARPPRGVRKFFEWRVANGRGI